MTPEPASTKTISAPDGTQYTVSLWGGEEPVIDVTAPDGTTHTLTLAEYAAFRRELENQKD